MAGVVGKLGPDKDYIDNFKNACILPEKEYLGIAQKLSNMEFQLQLTSSVAIVNLIVEATSGRMKEYRWLMQTFYYVTAAGDLPAVSMSGEAWQMPEEHRGFFTKLITLAQPVRDALKREPKMLAAWVESLNDARKAFEKAWTFEKEARELTGHLPEPQEKFLLESLTRELIQLLGAVIKNFATEASVESSLILDFHKIHEIVNIYKAFKMALNQILNLKNTHERMLELKNMMEHAFETALKTVILSEEFKLLLTRVVLFDAESSFEFYLKELENKSAEAFKLVSLDYLPPLVREDFLKGLGQFVQSQHHAHKLDLSMAAALQHKIKDLQNMLFESSHVSVGSRELAVATPVKGDSSVRRVSDATNLTASSETMAAVPASPAKMVEFPPSLVACHPEILKYEAARRQLESEMNRRAPGFMDASHPPRHPAAVGAFNVSAPFSGAGDVGPGGVRWTDIKQATPTGAYRGFPY